MVKVKVLRISDNKPATAISVDIIRHGSGFLDVGGVFRGEYTNRDGEVFYSKLDLPAKGKIIIDGHQFHDDTLLPDMTFKI
jgi:hypothetical protein